jgi:Cytochrome c/c1 heme lyase
MRGGRRSFQNQTRTAFSNQQATAQSSFPISSAAIMGSTTSKPDGSSPPLLPAVTTTTTSTASSEAMTKTVNGSSTGAVDQTPPAGGGCPMHQKDGSYSIDPFAAWKAGFPHGPSSSGIQPPLKAAAAAATTATTATNDQQHTEYNVYGQRINPANQMPTLPHQQPATGQQTVLSTERVPSTIPKVRKKMVLQCIVYVYNDDFWLPL